MSEQATTQEPIDTVSTAKAREYMEATKANERSLKRQGEMLSAILAEHLARRRKRR